MYSVLYENYVIEYLKLTVLLLIVNVSSYITFRDGKTTIFFGPALLVVPFPGPARPVIQFLILGPFGPAKIYSVQCPKLRLLSTNYLVLTDLQGRRQGFGSGGGHSAKQLLNGDF